MPVTEEDWVRLEGQMPVGDLRASRLGTKDSYLAIDHEGFRHLLVALPDLGEAVSDERSRGLSVRGRNLRVENDPEAPFLDVACTQRIGHPAFSLVVSDILVRLDDGGRPGPTILAILARWRRFWGAAPSMGLSSEEIKGLFGELWFLRSWLMPRGLDNVNRWAGPLGALHDFEWSDRAVEAKTTSSTRGHIHRIHGLEQLTAPVGTRLYLFSLRVREDPESSTSLVSLVRAITALLENSPALLDSFEERLARARYSPVDAARYDQTRFRVLGERLYLVEGSFPKLTIASFIGGVPEGIELVDYEVNLAVCPGCCVAESPSECGAMLDP